MGIKANNLRSALLGAAALGVLSIGFGTDAAAGVAGPINTGSTSGRVEIQYNGFTSETQLTAGSNESTWGAGFITSIFEFGNSSNLFYSNGTPGIDRIGYVLYGIADGNITTGTTSTFDIYNIGCTGGPCDGKIHIDFYLMPNGSPTNFGTDLAPTDRTGFSTFTGITDVGTLFMSWEMVPGLQLVDVPGGTNPGFDERTSVMVQHSSDDTLPATGNGNFLADCVGGPGCVLFDNNGQIAGSDFFGQFTLTPPAGSPATNGWQGRTSDPVETAVVPEPATLTLIGASLLGLGLVRRRRQ